MGRLFLFLSWILLSLSLFLSLLLFHCLPPSLRLMWLSAFWKQDALIWKQWLRSCRTLIHLRVPADTGSRSDTSVLLFPDLRCVSRRQNVTRLITLRDVMETKGRATADIANLGSPTCFCSLIHSALASWLTVLSATRQERHSLVRWDFITELRPRRQLFHSLTVWKCDDCHQNHLWKSLQWIFLIAGVYEQTKKRINS